MSYEALSKINDLLSAINSQNEKHVANISNLELTLKYKLMYFVAISDLESLYLTCKEWRNAFNSFTPNNYAGKLLYCKYFGLQIHETFKKITNSSFQLLQSVLSPLAHSNWYYLIRARYELQKRIFYLKWISLSPSNIYQGCSFHLWCTKFPNNFTNLIHPNDQYSTPKELTYGFAMTICQILLQIHHFSPFHRSPILRASMFLRKRSNQYCIESFIPLKTYMDEIYNVVKHRDYMNATIKLLKYDYPDYSELFTALFHSVIVIDIKPGFFQQGIDDHMEMRQEKALLTLGFGFFVDRSDDTHHVKELKFILKKLYDPMILTQHYWQIDYGENRNYFDIFNFGKQTEVKFCRKLSDFVSHIFENHNFEYYEVLTFGYCRSNNIDFPNIIAKLIENYLKLNQNENDTVNDIKKQLICKEDKTMSFEEQRWRQYNDSKFEQWRSYQMDHDDFYFFSDKLLQIQFMKQIMIPFLEMGAYYDRYNKFVQCEVDTELQIEW